MEATPKKQATICKLDHALGDESGDHWLQAVISYLPRLYLVHTPDELCPPLPHPAMPIAADIRLQSRSTNPCRSLPGLRQ
jgi:hypothetical protein